jgi:acyl carrier protein
MHRDTVVQSIYGALRRANDLRAPHDHLECAETTVLYGREGCLDSLGLVSLILDVEEAVNAHTARNLVLADERAMARQRSPFRTVQSLADYVMAQLETSTHA